MNNIVTSIVMSVCFSLLASGFLVRLLAKGTVDRWMKAVEARYSRELEQLRDSLARGSYVTGAQYDLELASFQALWKLMASLRTTARSLLASRKILITNADGSSSGSRMGKAQIEAFFTAHNDPIHGTEISAPFYPKAIKQNARRTTEYSLRLVNSLGDFSLPRETEEWYEILETLCSELSGHVATIEELIRERLEGLKIVE